MRQIFSLCAILAAVLALAILNACGGSSTSSNSSPASGTFQSVYGAISSSSCFNCHKAGGSATSDGVSLDLSSATSAYAGLTTGSAVGSQVPSCHGVPYVSGSNPSSSYLMAVLFSDYSATNFGKAGCSPYYSSHVLSFSLSAAEKQSFVAWINAGAPNN